MFRFNEAVGYSACKSAVCELGHFPLAISKNWYWRVKVSKHPELLLLAHPSNGLDVGAIESVYQRLFRLRDKGASIIFCSNDLEEIMSLSDRVVLFERGQIIGQYYTQQLNKNELSLMLANEVMSE